jgi:hypothetical protein
LKPIGATALRVPLRPRPSSKSNINAAAGHVLHSAEQLLLSKIEIASGKCR